MRTASGPLMAAALAADRRPAPSVLDLLLRPASSATTVAARIRTIAPARRRQVELAAQVMTTSASSGGRVGTITIDRPDRFNSLDVRTAQDFRRAGLRLRARRRDPRRRAARAARACSAAAPT